METVQEYDEINFTHHYHKLNYDDFTTIRGKSTIDQYPTGKIFNIYVDREYQFRAIVEYSQLIKIDNISLATLKEDGEYPGFTIDTREEFINLLNSFWPRNTFETAKADQDSKVTLITLRKIEEVKD